MTDRKSDHSFVSAAPHWIDTPDAEIAPVDYIVNRYARVRAWQDSSAMLANDLLYALCSAVVDGEVGLRDAARQIGMSKSSLGRMVDMVREGSWPATPLSPFLVQEVHDSIHVDTYGMYAELPFRTLLVGDRAVPFALEDVPAEVLEAEGEQEAETVPDGALSHA